MDSNFILEIENSLSPEICKHIIERFEKDPNKVQSMVGVSDNPETSRMDLTLRNSKEVRISWSQEWNDIDIIISRSLKDAIKRYKDEIENFAGSIGEDRTWISCNLVCLNNLSDCGYVVQRVEKNTGYRWHHDFSFKNNILSCIWYLNDMDEEDGGVTEFINGRKIQPKAGKLLMFPATWTNIHRGNVIKEKHKYMCTTGLLANVI